MNRYISLLFLILVFFPYVTLIKLGSDIQPYSLLFSMLILFYRGLPDNFMAYMVLVFAFLSGFIFLFSPILFSSVRGFASAISFSMVFLATMSCLPYISARRLLVFLWCALVIYLLAAVYQSVFGPNSLIFLSPRYFSYGGYLGRGVDSLTAEPTFYGFTVLLLAMVYSSIRRSWSIDCVVFWLVSFFQIAFVAKSSSALVTALVVLSGYIFIISRVSYMLIPVVLFVGLVVYFPILSFIPEDSRLFAVLTSLQDPVSFFTNDLSANDRFYNMYYSYAGFFDNYMWPHGFSRWNDYLMDASKYNLNVVNITGEDERILSLFGGVLYEYGFLSVVFFFVFFYCFYCVAVRRDIFSFFIIFFICFFMFSQAIPLSHPMVAFLLVASLYFGRFSRMESHNA